MKHGKLQRKREREREREREKEKNNATVSAVRNELCQDQDEPMQRDHCKRLHFRVQIVVPPLFAQQLHQEVNYERVVVLDL